MVVATERRIYLADLDRPDVTAIPRQLDASAVGQLVRQNVDPALTNNPYAVTDLQTVFTCQRQ
ncbi:hypothetical protein D3C84_679330 [compost metagenome]